jgi:RNA polymerase sigma factor (sigma-70 family)
MIYPLHASSMSEILGDYLRSIGRIPLLTAQEELHCGRLVRSWLDCPQIDTPTRRRGRHALKRMVTANLRLVVSVVKRQQPVIQRRKLEAIDLIQAGNLGLIRAAERYDPTRGYRFSTFAFWWIRQAVGRHLQECQGAIRLPYAVQLLALRLQSLRSSDSQGLSVAGIAALLGESPERIEQVVASLNCNRLISLDQSLGDGDEQGFTLMDVVASDQTNAVRDDYAWLHGQIAQLSPLEQDVLEARYGEESTSVNRIAKRLGRSRHQIQTIEKRAMQRLRQAIRPMLNPGHLG